LTGGGEKKRSTRPTDGGGEIVSIDGRAKKEGQKREGVAPAVFCEKKKGKDYKKTREEWGPTAPKQARVARYEGFIRGEGTLKGGKKERIRFMEGETSSAESVGLDATAPHWKPAVPSAKRERSKKGFQNKKNGKDTRKQSYFYGGKRKPTDSKRKKNQLCRRGGRRKTNAVESQ